LLGSYARAQKFRGATHTERLANVLNMPNDRRQDNAIIAATGYELVTKELKFGVMVGEKIFSSQYYSN
jgi:hypothetical protein